jgi:transcriptional antiterminator Rof (Rho-off)
MDYQQISCSLFDRIESLSVTKKIVQVNYISDDNNSNIVKGFIKDVFSENKSEYLLINNVKIRLDKINTINEI